MNNFHGRFCNIFIDDFEQVVTHSVDTWGGL